jgi:hypothetical protein
MIMTRTEAVYAKWSPCRSRVIVILNMLRHLTKKSPLPFRYLFCFFINTTKLFLFSSTGAKCVRATYTDQGNKIGVFNEQINTM